MVSERDAGWGGRGAMLDEALGGWCGLAAASRQLVDPSRRPCALPRATARLVRRTRDDGLEVGPLVDGTQCGRGEG